MEGLRLDRAKAIIECLLFASSDPLTPKVAAEIMGLDEKTARNLLLELKDFYDSQGRGIQVVEVAGGFQMATRPEYAAYVKELAKTPKYTPLSPAALETLAIIAYKQPITKSEIEHIRGVRIEGVLGTLLERGLVKEVGRKEAVGRPILYGTTDSFLKYLGLRDLSELPPLPTVPEPSESDGGRPEAVAVASDSAESARQADETASGAESE